MWDLCDVASMPNCAMFCHYLAVPLSCCALAMRFFFRAAHLLVVPRVAMLGCSVIDATV